MVFQQVNSLSGPGVSLALKYAIPRGYLFSAVAQSGITSRTVCSTVLGGVSNPPTLSLDGGRVYGERYKLVYILHAYQRHVIPNPRVAALVAAPGFTHSHSTVRFWTTEQENQAEERGSYTPPLLNPTNCLR